MRSTMNRRSTILSQIRALATSVLFCALGAPALAERVVATLDVTSVRFEVNWVADAAALAHVRAEYERPAFHMREAASNAAWGRVHGFSVLVKRGEEYICRLYAVRPTQVDDERTLALGHEALHCLLGDFHR
jgi:hypothetical protein